MKSTLSIVDLPVSKELDAKELAAVSGGQGDQANSTGQMNLQAMLAQANVGNGLVVGANSPVIIQSDNTFTQDASNENYPYNYKSLDVLLSNF
jgi:bacteriocin-like protein